MKTSLLTPTAWLGIAALTASVWAAQPSAPAFGGAAQASGPANLTFNFRGASIESVLTYLADQAGYLISYESPVRGTVDAYASQPVTREEALQLVFLALNKNGFTAVMQGRTMIISSKEDAKKKSLPIRTGNSPDEIPNTAEMFIQIIPLRRLDATNAARDLGALLPGTSTLTANIDSNSLVVTDTNINLKQVVTLVNALDNSTDSISTSEIIYLKNADPNEMAQLILNLYASNNTAGGGANAFGAAGGRGGAAAFGGAAGGRGGAAGGRGGAAAFGGRGGRGGAGGGGGRLTPVTAVADPRTYAVIISASKEQMPDIVETVKQLDSNPARKQKVFVYTLENANVRQAETALRSLFPSTRTQANNQQVVDALEQRARANAQQGAGTATQLGVGGAGGGRGGN